MLVGNRVMACTVFDTEQEQRSAMFDVKSACKRVPDIRALHGTTLMVKQRPIAVIGDHYHKSEHDPYLFGIRDFPF